VVTVIVVDGQPVQNTDTNKVLRFSPETTPLLLDYEEFHPRPPKFGKNVVYMDDHVAPLEVLQTDNVLPRKAYCADGEISYKGGVRPSSGATSRDSPGAFAFS
jgi:hypothetical protein